MNTSPELFDFEPIPAYDDVDVIDVVDPLADVVDPLLRLPSPNVDVELDDEFFLGVFLDFLSDLSEGAVDGCVGVGRDVEDPNEKPV